MRVCLDASVWLSALITPRGFSAYILGMAANGKFTLISSDTIMAEVRRNAVEHKPPLIEALHTRLRDIRPEKIIVTTEACARFPGVPEHDRHVIATAFNGRADVLVSRDRHHILENQDARRGVAVIVNPVDFLKLWRAEEQKGNQEPSAPGARPKS